MVGVWLDLDDNEEISCVHIQMDVFCAGVCVCVGVS